MFVAEMLESQPTRWREGGCECYGCVCELPNIGVGVGILVSRDALCKPTKRTVCAESAVF